MGSTVTDSFGPTRGGFATFCDRTYSPRRHQDTKIGWTVVKEFCFVSYSMTYLIIKWNLKTLLLLTLNNVSIMWWMRWLLFSVISWRSGCYFCGEKDRQQFCWSKNVGVWAMGKPQVCNNNNNSSSLFCTICVFVYTRWPAMSPECLLCIDDRIPVVRMSLDEIATT